MTSVSDLLLTPPNAPRSRYSAPGPGCLGKAKGGGRVAKIGMGTRADSYVQRFYAFL